MLNTMPYAKQKHKIGWPSSNRYKIAICKIPQTVKK
jgi:hypothetical protein